jgi:ABC-type sugar transport system substrate-binding protein
VCIATILGLIFLRATWGLAIGVLGLLLGTAGISLQEARPRVYRSRRILFLSSSDSWFSQQIWQGMQDRMQGQVNHELIRIRPNSPYDNKSVDAQIACLRENHGSRPDAIVIRPSTITDALSRELITYSLEGTLVVFINTRPPIAQWRSSGAPLPRFVGCDMEAAGVILGRLLCDLVDSMGASGVILIEGPSTKHSNAIRTAWAVREIVTTKAGLHSSLLVVNDFDDKEIVEAFANGIAMLDTQAGCPVERIAACPGTDRAASAVGRWIVENDSILLGAHRDIQMVGCDGLRQPDGRLLITDVPAVVATVDQQPYLIGQEAAAHIIAAFVGRTALHPREIVVQPRVTHS